MLGIDGYGPLGEVIETWHYTLPLVKNLIIEYNNCKSTEETKFNLTPFDKERFIAVLEESVKRFSYQARFSEDLDYNTHYGFIEKCDLPPGSKIYVRADLHGDLVSLLENLNTLQKEGHFDEHFKCSPGVHLVFLGDYLDRGAYELQVVELLACLRLENPTQVFLLRGNHEDLYINAMYANTAELKDMISTQSSLLLKFYQTLSLSVYLGEKGVKRQYMHFTHGLFELCTDPSGMLDSDIERKGMIIPKEQSFSERIKQIKADPEFDYYTAIATEVDKKKRKELKLALASGIVQDLALREKREDKSFTTYNWGDVKSSGRSITDEPLNRNWSINPEDVKHYMRLCQGVNSEVKGAIRGHQHVHEHHRHYKNKDKVFMTTLTVGMDAHSLYQQQFDQDDLSYIITVAPKVRDWHKQGISRKPKSWETKLTDKVIITSDLV